MKKLLKWHPKSIIHLTSIAALIFHRFWIHFGYHFGSILETLGPFWDHYLTKSIQNRIKIGLGRNCAPKTPCICLSRRCWDHFGTAGFRFWIPKCIQNRLKSIQKRSSMWVCFRLCYMIVFFKLF